MTSPNQNSSIESCIRTEIDINNNNNNSSYNLQTNETNQGHPESWSRQQVIDWVKWCSSEYGLHDIAINKFEMNGKALCMLTEEMFKQRVPNSGDILYRALKNLLPKTHQEQQQQQSQPQLANSEFQLPGIKLDLNDSSSICSKNTQDIAQSTDPSTVNSVSSSSSSYSSTNCSSTLNTTTSYSNNSICFNSQSANKITTKPKLNTTKQQQQPATLNKKGTNNSLKEFKMKQNLSETASHNSIPMLSSSSSSSLLSSSSSSSSSSSTLLLQKSASKFLPLITINQNKTNEMSLNRKKSKFNTTDNETYDTNNKTELTDCNMENETESNNEQFDDEDTNNNNDDDNEDYDYDDVDSDEDQQTSPVSKLTISSVNSSITGNLNTNSPNFERKRTANLENLIGNLKVRKLNQSDLGSGKEKNNNNNYHHNNSNNKMTSLYVDIANGGAGVGATSLSDCSPSTPPLSSPSVSPSSLSIASDSPVHASSFSSSSSSLANTHHQNANEINNQNNKSRYSMLPKLRWIIESGGSGANFDMNNSNEIKSAAVVAAALNGFDPAKLNEIINESWCADQASGATTTNDSTDNTKKKSSKLTKKQQQQQQDPESKVKTASGNKHPAGSLSTGHKNQEDPTRQIKFYDDFIDFRGDVLRRPPDSKNCRILWEYLYLLLQNNNYSTVIRWEDEAHMVFRIVQAEKLAALWGLQKNRLGMTYEKLSRGMRYYYPNNIIAREPGRRLLYRFMRHPDEIKKFVKKNGTYMLKRAKMSAKNNDTMDTGANLDESMRTSITDINPDDSGVDEPLNGSLVGTTSTNATGLTTTNKNKQSKKKAANIDNLNAMNNKNKNKVKNHSNKKSDMSNKNNLIECNREGNEDPDEDGDDEEFTDEANNNKDDSTVDEEANDQHSSYKMDSMSSSPYSGISHNSSGAIGFKPMGEDNNNSNNNNNTNGEMKSNNNNTQQANATAAFIAAMAGANRMYPDLYSPNDLFQYYAAAAGLQQSPIASAYLSRFLKSSPTSSSTSSTSSSKDDMNTAQLLMQLRNQNDSLLNSFNFENHNINNQFISDTIKNFTNLNRTTSNHHNLINNNNNNNNDNMQKSKRTSTARSNDLSSASSTSSNSSLEHSIDYEQNNQNQFSDKSFISRKQTKTKPNNNNNEHINYEELKATHNNSYEYPLNLSICGNALASNGGNSANSLKKRKSKYDI